MAPYLSATNFAGFGVMKNYERWGRFRRNPPPTPPPHSHSLSFTEKRHIWCDGLLLQEGKQLHTTNSFSFNHVDVFNLCMLFQTIDVMQ